MSVKFNITNFDFDKRNRVRFFVGPLTLQGDGLGAADEGECAMVIAARKGHLDVTRTVGCTRVSAAHTTSFETLTPSISRR